MPLKYIWCSIKKTDIILFLILPLNKAIISETVNILYCLIEHLKLVCVIENKVILIKDNYLTVKNMTYATYQK